MKQVQVLLSTYNGEHYISNQLQSILRQSYPHISVLVRDDGSSDQTLVLLKEYVKAYPDRIQVIVGSNLGVVSSFFELVQQSDPHADYYCFCDQDDVWLEQKIERAVTMLSSQADHVPGMVFTSTELADKDLNSLGTWPKLPLREASFYNALVQNIAVGATITLNKAARNKFMEGNQIDPTKIIMHDWWFYLLVSGFGNVMYDKNPSMLYRQHENNVVGGSNSLFNKLKQKYRSYIKHKGEHLLVKQASEFYRVYGHLMEDSKREQLELFIAPRERLREKIDFLQKSKLYRQSIVEQLLFRFLILVGYI
ncbi:glycosyltransferase family 2 protein [Paenibacillus glucanolyticus]|jgi:glycosyltransferase involved in cell wall biosynthesis|uniref:glycosyltransferase family 2 protein n=1 Tax=Paenibacillus TaxID=44249 RepID=UPI0003E2C6DC|nr:MULTISPECIES: glycosyltransferase family 2 protein [Paenibacillus]ANA79722.1 glycosyl transferase family 2 [Paenibacillus glucanolyticus]AVV56255.1 glycosyltransferase family 2 protein [Paenibacillus glucanolyticus]ETT34073.1 glycosyltransferase [Paenibacillus sp. FSL R5-808]